MNTEATKVAHVTVRHPWDGKWVVTPVTELSAPYPKVMTVNCLDQKGNSWERVGKFCPVEWRYAR